MTLSQRVNALASRLRCSGSQRFWRLHRRRTGRPRADGCPRAQHVHHASLDRIETTELVGITKALVKGALDLARGQRVRLIIWVFLELVADYSTVGGLALGTVIGRCMTLDQNAAVHAPDINGIARIGNDPHGLDLSRRAEQGIHFSRPTGISASYRRESGRTTRQKLLTILLCGMTFCNTA